MTKYLFGKMFDQILLKWFSIKNLKYDYYYIYLIWSIKSNQIFFFLKAKPLYIFFSDSYIQFQDYEFLL